MLKLTKIEDREYEGRCGSCGRENLRWIATLSDGTEAGLECTKKLLGYRPTVTNYQWTEHFTAVAEHTESTDVYVLWQAKRGRETRETRNGVLMSVGGARADWQKRGWLS